MTMKPFFLVMVLGLAFSTLAFAAEGGPAPLKKFLALLSAGDEATTTSLTFEDMPGMTASIRTSASACITATFSGAFDATQRATIDLRALLDNTLLEGHRDADDSAVVRIGPEASALASYTFWKCDVRSGSHTVRIQWASREGRMVFALSRTLIVEGK